MTPDRFNLDDYVTVNERLALFRADHPAWGLVCNLRFEGDAILARAEIADETGRIIAVGHAEEIRDQGMVNKTSAVENAETSAWGRALANLGYEVKRSIASREEMEKVSRAGGRSRKATRGSATENDPQPGNVSQLRRASDDDVARHPSNGGEPVLKPWQAIAAVAQKFGISDDDRKAVMVAVSGKEHSRDLTVDEVGDVMRQLRWLHDGFVRLDFDDAGRPVLVDAKPANPGPASPGQRVDG